mmetsp:Transcript_14895/g.31828  ORF Transcript_14895/g.31828 Transcript_14895/m.31828 type:complete len:81 (+) Transcript_14895:121-363(+)
MFDQIRMFQSLACEHKYSAGAEYANVFCTTGRNNTVYDTEWPDFTGSYSTVYTTDTGVNGSAAFDVNTTTAPSLFPSIHA